MTLKECLEKGFIKKQATSKEEIKNLLGIVERDLTDSALEVTEDWKFGIAYNAALKLATILLRSSGYRTSGLGHHGNTIALIPVILGKHKKDDADYLDACRKKRNILEYDYVGCVTENEVVELREFVIEFKKEVLDWLREKHSDLYI